MRLLLLSPQYAVPHRTTIGIRPDAPAVPQPNPDLQDLERNDTLSLRDRTKRRRDVQCRVDTRPTVDRLGSLVSIDVPRHA